MKKFLKKLAEYPDRVLAVSGAIVLVVVMVILLLRDYSILYVIASGMGVFGCLSYLYIRKNKNEIKLQSSLLYDIAYLILLIASILVYLLRPEQYSRPMVFFVLLSLIAGTLAVKIIVQKSRDWLTIIEICGFGLLATLSISFLYPSLIGMDSYWHMQQTMRIVNEGHIDYHSLPTMYLWIAEFIKATGFDYRLATINSVAIPVTIANIYLTYYLGKTIGGNKVGLLSGLVVAFTGWNIFFIVWTIPNIFAVPMLLGIIICSLKWLKNELNIKWYAVWVIVLTGMLIYTHPIATIWSCIFLLSMCGLVGIRWLLTKNRDKLYHCIGITLVLLGLVFGLWSGLGYTKQLINIINYEFSPELLGLTAPSIIGSEPKIITMNTSGLNEAGIVEQEPVVETTVIADSIAEDIEEKFVMPDNPSTEMLSSASLGESFWNVSGMFMYFMLALAGVWYFFRKKASLPEILIAFYGLVILGAGFMPMLLGMSFLEHRWWLLAEIILSVPVAWFLLKMSNRWMVYPAGILVALLCFMNLTGLPSNMDNRDISDGQLARYAFTADEIEGMWYVSAEYEGSIGVDEYYTLSSNIEGLVTNKDGRIINISPELINGGLIDTELVIIREEVRNGLLASGSGTVYRLNYDPVEKLISEGYIEIYRNNDVICLSR